MEKIKTRDQIDEKYKWDLSSIYKDVELFNKDLEILEERSKELQKYKNSILNSSDNLYQSLKLDFDLSRLSSKLYCYAIMKSHEDTTIDSIQVLIGKLDKEMVKINEETAFFHNEILQGDFSLIKKYIKENKNLKEYEFYLEDLFRSKDHMLSLKEEELIARASEILEAPSNIFDKIVNTDIKFSKFKDETGKTIELNASNYSKYIESYNPKIRKEVFKKLYKTYSSFKNTISKCLISDIKVNEFISQTRKYQNPLQMSLDDDNIDPQLYDKLIQKTSANLDNLHQYISLRKNILGIEKLHMYDLYVPLIKNVNKQYTYEEAKNIVLNALKPLGDEYQSLLKKAFNERWIDVYFNSGKKVGAYSWGSYDTKPFLLLNYEGTLNDVSTLAHELGHSIHSYYSNSNQKYEYANYSIFLAEIASTVNEILLNKYLYKIAKSKEEKLYYLNDLLDTLRTTLYRQTMFAEFEKIIYEKEETETLTEELLSNIYLKLNKKYYGKAVIHDKEIKYEWLRIPHFYNSFYVYQYATGIIIASKIVRDILQNKTDALNNYIEFLKSGSSDYPLLILKKVGIDILNDNTIDDGLKLFEETLKEFKRVLES